MTYFDRKWKEDKSALLDEMDEKERQDQEDWIAQGKKELEEWYARLNEQLGKTKENNRCEIYSCKKIFVMKNFECN